MTPNSEASGLTDDELLSAFCEATGWKRNPLGVFNPPDCGPRFMQRDEAVKGMRSIVAAHEAKRPPSTTAEAMAPSLREQLQQQCSDWGAYWRASDAHGVELTREQAVELLARAVGVEVEIAHPAPSTTVAAGEASERFVPIGACTCAGPDGPCESCIANREAYEEWLAERSTPPTDPKADLLRMMAEVLERARHYVVKASSTGPISASLLTDIDQLLQEARQ